jgi:group I intron endonuclease
LPNIEILEYCEPADALEREDHYLKQLNPEYNSLKVVSSSAGFKQSEETRVKISASLLGKNKGKTRSKELRSQISATLLGKNICRSEATRAKLSA